jgi:hypothetical protein
MNRCIKHSQRDDYPIYEYGLWRHCCYIGTQDRRSYEWICINHYGAVDQTDSACMTQVQIDHNEGGGQFVNIFAVVTHVCLVIAALFIAMFASLASLFVVCFTVRFVIASGILLGLQLVAGICKCNNKFSTNCSNMFDNCS